MKVVIKIGGSILVPKEFDTAFAKKLAEKLKEWSRKHEIAIVIGGGKLSREFGEIGRKITDDEDFLDLIGIYASRLNAAMVIASLGNSACPVIPRSEIEFLEASDKFKGKIIVCGGFRPKQRTDAVAVEVANEWKADFVIKCTNVDYVYNKDPNKHKDAKPIKELSFEEIKEYADKEHRANQPTIMDAVSAAMIAKEKVKVAVLNGKKLENIEKFLNREDFKGTRIGF